MGNDLSMAYRVSQYTGISHTLILQGVLGLRRLGFDISVASINSADRRPGPTKKEERQEPERTLYVKQVSASRVLKCHLRALLQSPLGHLSAFCVALRTGVGRDYVARDLVLATSDMADRSDVWQQKGRRKIDSADDAQGR